MQAELSVMAFNFKAQKLSFKDLSLRDEMIDFPDDEDDGKKAPKRNPFDFGDSDITFESSSKFVSKSEVKEFFKASRGITICDGDDEPLGEAWGGAEYSITTEVKPKPAQAMSARQRSTSGSQPASSSFPGRVTQNKLPSQPARPPASSFTQKHSSSPALAQKKTLTTPSSLSSSTSNKPASQPITASAVREKTGFSTLPTTKSAIQSASASISDAISSTSQISVHEYYRLQKEVAQLRRDLQAAKQSRLKAPPVVESVKRIIRGQPYSLELHKSLKDKVQLLDCALKMHDGNAIIAVILFLKRTVKRGIYLKEVAKRPKALHHLCKYLKEHFEFDELAQLYRILGRYEEAAILKLRQAIKSREPSDRLSTLRVALRDHLQPFTQLTELTASTKDYISLLEMQIVVENIDAKAEVERGNVMMVTHPRQASLPLCPVVVTLYYCCFYHYEEPEIDILFEMRWFFGEQELFKRKFACSICRTVYENAYKKYQPRFHAGKQTSPLALRNTFKLSDKQFEWTALEARARVKRWKDIDGILTGKGWFGSSKSRSLIGYEKVVSVLYKNRAPPDVLSKYLRLIDDQNKRVSLATKYKCHDVAIETIVALKDKQRLEQYRQELPAHALEHQSISNYLRNSQLRWKN